MIKRNKILTALFFLGLVLAFTAPAVQSVSAKDHEYNALVNHLKTKYRAKKVKIPFLWLARFAVSVVRPAGVKSFGFTLFENLKFSPETLDTEMQAIMRSSFDENWSPILRVRSREGQQVYMYMREAGKSVKIALVTIDKEQAAVIRATFSPEKLAEFVNDPKIFGISLGDTDQLSGNKPAESKDNADKDDDPEDKKEDTDKEN